MTPARILIVDDDATICQTFAAALTHEGYAVRVATTPTEALKQLAIETPHAILLDLDMPFINGVGFLYRLREQHVYRDIPVALITGAVPDDLTSRDLRDLRAEVWFKPVWLEDVLQITRGLLAKGRAQHPHHASFSGAI
jgi:CheY-like chemotaxis protein